MRGKRSPIGRRAGAESSSAVDAGAGAVLEADAEAATEGEQRRDAWGEGRPLCVPAGADGGGVTAPGEVAAAEP
jgi:hypothetical protein